MTSARLLMRGHVPVLATPSIDGASAGRLWRVLRWILLFAAVGVVIRTIVAGCEDAGGTTVYPSGTWVPVDLLANSASRLDSIYIRQQQSSISATKPTQFNHFQGHTNRRLRRQF